MIEFEKRKMERFFLELPANLIVDKENGEKKAIQLLTRDVCAGGAFFKTEKPLSVGTDLKICMIITFEKLQSLEGKRSRVDVSGSVIRKDQEGMAICFDKKYRISPC